MGGLDFCTRDVGVFRNLCGFCIPPRINHVVFHIPQMPKTAKSSIPKIVQILSRAFPRTIVSPKCTDRAFRYIIWVKGDSSEINFPELLAQIPAENHLHLAQSKKNKNSEQKRCTKWMGENPSSNGAKSANPDWLPIWISF